MTKAEEQKFDTLLKEQRKLIRDGKKARIEAAGREPTRKNLRLGKAEEEAADEMAWHFWMRWKCLTDLYFLGAVVLGLEKVKDPKTKRKRLDPNIHKEMAKQLMRSEDKLLLWPRLHLKTCWVVFRIIQLILINPFNRIGLFTITLTLGKKTMKMIKDYFQRPILLQLFPEVVKPKKEWAVDQAEVFTMWRDPEDAAKPKEGQVEIWGVEGNCVGHHYDYHFYDDIINEKTVRTANGINKVRDWWQHMQVIKDLGAVETMTGTRYHQRDIYGEIIAEDYFPTVIQRDCWKPGKRWKEAVYKFFTLKDLKRLLRRMGEYNFSCQLENVPVPPADKLFVAPYPRYRELPEKITWYIAVDPAYTTNVWSNETGISIGCVEADKPTTLFVKEAKSHKLQADEMAGLLVQKIALYGPRKVIIERNLGETLQFIIDVKIKEYETENGVALLRPEFVWLSPGNRNNKKVDKLRNTTAAFIRAEKMRFWYDGDFTEAFDEMGTFNPYSQENDDDILDSLSMLIQGVEDFASGTWWFKDMAEMTEPGGFTLEGLFKKKAKSGWESAFAV